MSGNEKQYKIILDRQKPEDELKASVLRSVEDYTDRNGLGAKNGRHICLAAEETMEMLRVLKCRQPDLMLIERDGTDVLLRFITTSCSDEVTGDEEPDFTDTKGVTGKLRLLYDCGYPGLEKNYIRAEEIGVRKALMKDFRQMGIEGASDAYVWTLQSYNLTAFDRVMEEDDEKWQEISHSILANLSEDIRLFIFPEKIELNIRIRLKKDDKTESGKYAISPEFDRLFKIPVVKTPFQVKMVQLMYGRLARKHKSEPDLEISEFKMSSGQSKKGSISILKYYPYSEDNRLPAVIFFHGGADLFPALPYHYRLAGKIAREVPCRVFMVMYDLAPEYNPPVQIREGFEVYRQLLEEKIYDVSPDRTVLMGDSSGGTIAAAVTLMSRDGKAPLPRGQVLLYPSLDARFNTPSMKKYTDVPVINADAINSYRKIIHADWSEGNRYYMSPTEADDFKGLCDTYIETAEFDALHDEGIEYAKKLEENGVRVVLNETNGTVHSFDMAEDSSILQEAMGRRIGFLKELFRT